MVALPTRASLPTMLCNILNQGNKNSSNGAKEALEDLLNVKIDNPDSPVFCVGRKMAPKVFQVFLTCILASIVPKPPLTELVHKMGYKRSSWLCAVVQMKVVATGGSGQLMHV